MSGSVRALKLCYRWPKTKKEAGGKVCQEAAGEKKCRSVEERVGTLKPANMTERKKADICACRRLHGSEVDSSCSSMVQIVREIA